ncbi:MAG: hypothetical protein IPI23_22055 [Bacteroidetes bacterium]|nr:hypothetical protein [Bacteroidota bacterium]
MQIPVFTTLGNHDYRPNAYDLIARIDAGDYGGYDLIPKGWKDEIVNQFGSMNLTLMKQKLFWEEIMCLLFNEYSCL